MSPRFFAATLALLTALALAVRLPRLAARPMHTDEAVNAYLLGEILRGEPFAFDPRDRHGPLLHAANLVTARLTGATSWATLDERTVRLAPAVVGAATTGLFALGHGLFPSAVLLVSAALWSFAPLPVYYARYAIQEPLLVAATMVFLFSLVRTTLAPTARRRLGWSLATGAAAALMLSAKFSALLPLAAAAVAGLAVSLPAWRRSGGPALRPVATTALLALATFLLVTAFAYTWGFTRAQGLHDLLLGGGAPLARAAGAGHEKGPLYFFTLLGSGASGPAFLLLAALGGAMAWRTSRPLARALVLYTATLLFLHSVIPYKTPWLALGLAWPLVMLAGWTATTLVTAAWIRRRSALVATSFGLAGVTTLTAADTRHFVFSEPAGESNPFAYAHTSPDLLRLPPFVAQLTAAQSDPLIAVCAADPWPLPFYLRAYDQAGFWTSAAQLPPELTPTVLLTTSDLVSTLPATFTNWRPHYFTQRPGVMLVALTPR